jgi:truncated hemoglobin YjbI
MSSVGTGQKRSRFANQEGAGKKVVGISLLFQRIGRDSFVALATEFHDRVYCDPDPQFRGLFAGIPKDVAIANQSEILMERMGGPAEFSKRQKRTPKPSSVSAPDQQQRQRRVQSYNQRLGSVNAKSASKWLDHMLGALESIDSIDAQSKVVMLTFFKQVASRLLQKVSKPPRPAPVPQGAARASTPVGSAPLMKSAPSPTSMAPSYAYAAPPPPQRSFVPPTGYSGSMDATPPFGPIVAMPLCSDAELSSAAAILTSASTGPVSDYLRPHASEDSLLGRKLLELPARSSYRS